MKLMKLIKRIKLITPKNIETQSVIVPGSKSISHRMLICAALCNGCSDITNLLLSEDILLTMDTLKNMGADIKEKKPGCFGVKGFNGLPLPHDKPLYLGNSGTSMRLLTGIAALGNTEFILTGDDRMCERPMKALLDALSKLDVIAESENTIGTPPIHITGGKRQGGPVSIDCSRSSQYLSSLLMMGAFMADGLDVRLESPPVSSPYIDLTIDIMKKFGVTADKVEATRYCVPGGQSYSSGDFFVEPDLSNAGYFWAIGAVTGKMIWVNHINPDSLQGDIKQIRILEQMGCTVKVEPGKIGVAGNDLKAVDVDMSDTPDAVPAIAVVAAHAKGKTRITNIRHLREKECDRIDAMAKGLTKMGITVHPGDDSLEIIGGSPKGAMIETFNDHRIAMAFSIPGLLIKGMEIQNPDCVAKSFPNYWEIFDNL